MMDNLIYEVLYMGVCYIVLLDDVREVLARDLAEVDSILSVKDSVREEAIRLSREIIRASADVTRMIHLGRFEEAGERLREAAEKAYAFMEKLRDHPDLFYSGLSYNCLSEYAEASIVYGLVVEKRMPGLGELGVPYVPYLQGLGDAVGEIRRYIIDLLRAGRYGEAGTYLDIMETIYEHLRGINYPDALTPGLRHKVDVARRLVEDTKILYINTVTAERLYRKLSEVAGEKD